MFKKGKYLLALIILLVVFASIIIAGAQEVPVANSFRFPLDGDWSPLLQDFNKWNSTWNGYHLGEDVGREDADIKEYTVYPMADGVVKFADVVMGHTVIIEHKLPNNDSDGNYICSVYYYMKRPGEGGIKLTVDELVSIDSPIGYISDKWEDHKSSPHLHFGIRKGRFVSDNVKDPRTGFWYYPGYTVIKKNGEVQKDPDDPTHKQILADWFNPSTDPKNGTGFIERHIAKIEQTTEISKTPPVITSPLKITPAPPYYYGDIIKAEFIIANRNLFPITLNVLTVGGRDPDNQVADFTHRQNIIIGPFESYNYKGTLTLKKLGYYHFFCTYQTSDGNWNTSIDLGYGLTDEDRTKDIVVKMKEGQYIVPEGSGKINIEWEKIFGGYGHDRADFIVQKGDGGYLVTGIKGGKNVWVFKLDERGTFEWDRIFGGKEDKFAYSIVRTGDEGCAVLACPIEEGDIYLSKIDEKSNVKWKKTPFIASLFGLAYVRDIPDSIIQTKNGYYTIVWGIEKDRYEGKDCNIFKYSAYPPPPEDNIKRRDYRIVFPYRPYTAINSFIQTKDGGYAGAGRSNRDAWVFKIDERGNLEWDKTYGEGRDDESYDEEEAYSLMQTKDGGYAIAGRKTRDIWVFKLDERGRVEWDKTFTRSNRKEWSIQRDMVASFIQTNDGGYAVAGNIDVSKTAYVVGPRATWVFKLNERGNLEWDKIFGEEADGITIAYSIIQAKNGGYVLAGRTNTKSGGDDVWVIKLKEQ